MSQLGYFHLKSHEYIKPTSRQLDKQREEISLYYYCINHVKSYVEMFSFLLKL